MKIIRKRSGFTTNSSASAEWVPPETDPALEQDSNNSESGTIKQDQPETPPGLPPWSKPLMSIGIVVVIVAGLFLLERWVRKIRKRIKDAKIENKY